MSHENGNNQPHKDQAGFGMPKGYFQNSANAIANKIEWETEHLLFTNLVRVKNKNVFTVPENYFNTNETKLELVGYEKLFSIAKKLGFLVPENYFEEREIAELTSFLNNSVDELESFKKLASIKKEVNFKVNDTYFSESNKRLYNSLKKEKSAQLFSLKHLKISHAAAAIFVIVIGVWTYQYYFKTVQLQDCGTIACIDKVDLVKTKNLESFDNEDLYELVNANELENTLNKKSLNSSSNNNSDSSFKDIDTDDLIDEL